MLPSMPNIVLSGKKNETSSNLDETATTKNNDVITEVDTKENIKLCGNTTNDGDEDDGSGKDNIDDINALMVASSTIKNVSKKTPSGSEKKKLKLRKEFIAHMTLVSPEDPIAVREKANSYVQAYYDKVQERLEVHEYHQFMQVLNNFDYRVSSTSSLYEQVTDILLPKYSDLADEFLTFLTPVEANALGKTKPHFMLRNMSLFLHKLGIYYKDQPSQLKKVYRSLTDLASCVDASMEMVKASILPLLKGNSLLTDWFLQIFPNERPPESLMSGPWEVVDVAREPTCNGKDEIFETVIIPDSEDPYGGSHCICTCHESEQNAFKLRHQHCIACGKRFLQGRVYVQTGKGLRLANITFDSNTEGHLKRLCGYTNSTVKKQTSPTKQISPTKDKDSQDDSEDDGDCLRKKTKAKAPRKRKVKAVGEKVEKPVKKPRVQSCGNNKGSGSSPEKSPKKSAKKVAVPKGVVSKVSDVGTQESVEDKEKSENKTDCTRQVNEAHEDNEAHESCEENGAHESCEDNEAHESSGELEAHESFGENDAHESCGENDNDAQESGGENEGQESGGENDGQESCGEIDAQESCGENEAHESCDEQDGRESFDEAEPHESSGECEAMEVEEIKDTNGHGSSVKEQENVTDEKAAVEEGNDVKSDASKRKADSNNISDSSIEPKPSEENVEWDCNTSIESVELKLSPEHSVGSESEIYEESSQDNINSDCEESEDDAVSLTQSPPPHSENSNSNLVFEEVAWARDEDKIILITLREMGNTEEAINHIAQQLENKTVDQIKSRFETLLSLLQQMAAASGTTD